MPTTASNNLNQVNKLVLEAFSAGAKSYVPQWNKVFITDLPTRVDEKFTIVKTDNDVTEVADGAAFPEGTIKEIGTNTITQKVYKASINLGDLAELFDNMGQIKRTATEKGADFAYKMDELGAAFLNNPTSTAAPYGLDVGSGSTISLVGNTQPIGDTGATQDNRVSGALDKDTFNDALILLQNMKRHNGNIAGYQARRLIVSTNDALNSWELTQSPNEPSSANNNRNYLNSLGIERIVWPLLTASTAFLLADKSDAGARGLRYLIKQLPTMRVITSQTTGTTTYQFRMVLQPGVADYLGVVSINV